MEVLSAAGRKGVIYNLATNKNAAEWALCEANIAYAAQHGHHIGLHLYFDENTEHYAGAWAWLPLLKKYGGNWCLTEVGYLRTIFDANHGWINKLSQGRYDFLAAWFLADVRGRAGRNLPVMWYSLDDWPIGDEGRVSGTGLWRASLFIQALSALNQSYRVEETPPVTTIPPISSAPALMQVNAIKGLKIHSAPTLAAPVTGQLAYKQFVTAYLQPSDLQEDNYNWVRINFPTSGQWVARNYLSPVTTDPPPANDNTVTLTATEAAEVRAAAQRILALVPEVKPSSNGGGF